jgi:uncharacterized phage protein gp47/JayE
MSENYGLLEQGFRAKDLSTLIQENIGYFKELFGQDVDSTPMNPLVKVNEVFCRQLEREWVDLGNQFDSQQIQFATGRFLRDLGIQMGLPQKDAEKASSRLTFYKTSTNVVVVPQGTVVDNNSDVFLKEFEVDERIELPAIFIVQRGGSAGGSDDINAYIGFTDFFDIESVEWVSDNIDGTSPYTLTTDYTLTVVGGFVTAIDWSPGGSEPSGGAIYYVKVGAFKAFIDATAKEAGSSYNAEVDEIFNLQSQIAGIAKVNNEESILDGRDQESELQHRRRLLNGSYILKNDEQIQSFLNQLHRVESSNVFTLTNTGHFRSLIYTAETSSTVIVSVYNESINEVELRKGAGTESVAIIRLIHGGAGGIDQFPSPYRQDGGEVGTWDIDWVSDNRDGSSPYTPGVDYVVYSNYDNQIDWSPGGAEPGVGNQYFVKLVRVVEISETFPIKISARLTLNQGYEITTVNNDLFITLNDYIKTIGISGILFYTEIARIINEHEGIAFIDNLKFTLTSRIWKGGAGGTDDLPINGSGFSDDGNTDIIWVSDNKDGSSPYTVVVDYLWDITAVNDRGIDWSPGGAEPTSAYPYWTKVEIRGDVTPDNDVIIILEEVDFTL